MKLSSLLFLILLMPVIGSKCSFFVEPEPSAFIVVTNDVTEIGQFGATCNGTVTSTNGKSSILMHGACWDTKSRTEPVDYSYREENGFGGYGKFLIQLTFLERDTKYYVRAYAANSTDTIYGEEKTFRTAPR